MRDDHHFIFALLSALALVLLVSLPALSHAQKQTLTVHYHERLPLFGTVNNTLGGIIGNRVQAVFKEAGVPCVFESTPPKRMFLLLEENNESLCLVGGFHTPARERTAIYSKPIFRDSQRIILARANNPHIQDNLSLEQLLSDPEPILLVKNGYSYGTELDKMMAHHMPRIASTSTNNENMVGMIHAGRADYMLISRDEANAIIQKAEFNPADLRLADLPGMPEGNKRYLLFSKRVDMAIVERINQAIEKLYPLTED